MKTYNLVRGLEENKFFCFNLVETNGHQFIQKSLKSEYYYLKKEFVDFEKMIQASNLVGLPEIMEVTEIECDSIFSIIEKVEGKSLAEIVNEKKESIEDILFYLIDIVNFLKTMKNESIGICDISYNDVIVTEFAGIEVHNLLSEAFLQELDVKNNIEDLISNVMFGFPQDSIKSKLNVISDPVLEEIQRLLEQLEGGEIVDGKLDYVYDFLSELVYNLGLSKDQNSFIVSASKEVLDQKVPEKTKSSSNLFFREIIILIIIIVGYFLYNHLSEQERIVKTRNVKGSAVPSTSVRKESRKQSPGKAKKGKSEYQKPEMILVKGGSFMMGYDKSGNKDEKPAHEVVVQDYYMGKYEVTVDDYKYFVEDVDYVTEIEKIGVTWGYVKGQIDLATGYSWSNTGFKQDGKHPVVCINWYDVLEYCNWLSRAEGLNEYYKINRKKIDKNNLGGFDTKKWTVTINKKSNGYRLPTEAEWEFAARSGGKDLMWSGCNKRSLVPKYGNVADSSSKLDVTDKDLDDGFEFTAKAGSFRS